jgi:TLC domain
MAFVQLGCCPMLRRACGLPCSVTKVGAVVFMLHDINDIFLELAKMFRYARTPILPNFWFALFLLSWIVTRLAIFPNWVIRSTLFDTLVRNRAPESLYSCALDIDTTPALLMRLMLRQALHCMVRMVDDGIQLDVQAVAKEQPVYVNVHPHYEIFNGLLLLLLVLHIYW